MCPVCNGFSRLEEKCPTCRHLMEDEGNIQSYYGPYSPYRGIDDEKLYNNYPDLVAHQCIHVLACEHCGHQATYAVQEITSLSAEL
ncbi:hypothetical protein [Aneurinibacillus terranovensis]|uniref:hypothetical protein n=1 Tax=Aneurinibacillus terranovensis TaxID=278991 RepID=UPI00054F3796